MAEFDARKAFDELPNATIAADETQRICFANRAVKRLLGWDPESLVDLPLSTLFPPPHQMMELERPMVVRAARPDGTLIEVELILTGDSESLLLATLRKPDVSSEAQDSLRKLRAILQTISIGVVLAEGPDGKITVVNPAADKIAGEPVRANSYPEFVANFPLERLDGVPLEIAERPLARTMKSGKPISEIVRYHRKDGKALILEVTTAAFPGPSGGAVTTFLDVTPRYELEQDLAQTAAQLRALLDHLPVGIAYFDKMAVCRAGNAPASRYLNRTKKDIVGVPADEIFMQEPGLRAAIHRCVMDQHPSFQNAVPWPDNAQPGAIRYLDWQFVPLSSEPGKTRGALALIVDVTERTLVEAERQRALEAIEGASRRKTQFLSAVSHDLRTPVNALSLQAELLTRIVQMREDEDGELTNMATDIRVAAGNLIELINDLLDLTRFDSGAIEHRPTEFPLDDWLASTLAPLEVSAHNRGLEFSWTPDRSGRLIYADRVKLGRVLTNLVGNAVKFTEHGRVEIHAGTSENGEFTLSVKDTGPGIPSNQLEQIFDEFAQLRNPERDRTKGTGLGLAICRRLVEAVGGRLEVESEVGHGSTFTAIYPASHLPAGSSEPPSAHYVVFPPGREPGDGKATSILLVEHDETSRNTLKRLLEQEGFIVRTAKTVDETFKRLRERRPSLLLLDFSMPGMDGRQMLNRLHSLENFGSMKIVVLSNEIMNAETGEIQSIDADGMLSKPFDLVSLRELLSVILPDSPA